MWPLGENEGFAKQSLPLGIGGGFFCVLSNRRLLLLLIDVDKCANLGYQVPESKGRDVGISKQQSGKGGRV